jgi:nucleotide-binding universal stress UspA family protein
MYANVIVGVDGREGGRDAAALTAMLAACDAFVSLVHLTTATPTANRATVRALKFADEESLPIVLDQELELCGGDAQLTRAPATSVGAGLEDIAERRGADLIIVGASRRHGIARLFTADDVRGVMHRTPCAVAVAPAGYAEGLRVPARIGVAFDGSPESEIALAHAGLLAAERRSLLIVQHAVEPRFYALGWGMAAAPVDDPASELAAARERMPEADGIEIQHVYGTPHEQLVALSEQVDLLVCGSRRRGPVKRLAIGSTSEYLARHVATPLLIAPPVDSAAVARWRAHRSVAAV